MRGLRKMASSRVWRDEGRDRREVAEEAARDLDAQALRRAEVLRAAGSAGVFVDEDGQLAVRG